jgi:hypothetical protein
MALLPSALTKVYGELVSIKVAVNSPETKIAVRKHWDNCTAWLRQNKTAVDSLKEPFKKEIKAIDDANKPMVEKVKGMEYEAERAILAYDQKERAKIQAANTKKLETYETKVATKEAEAIANGKPLPIVIPPSMKAEPAKTIIVGETKQTTVTRKSWWLKGIPQPRDTYGLFCGDPSKEFKELTMKDNNIRAKFDGGPELIPNEYFVLDVAKVGSVIRAGGTIPGIETVIVESLSGRAV